MKIFNLNQLWEYIGVTEFSFLFCLKIFFLILFILLNLCLLYLEFKVNKFKANSEILQSGFKRDIRSILSSFLTAAGAYSTYITIRNENRDNSKLEEYKNSYLKAKEEIKKLKDEKISNNLYNKLHYNSIDRSFIDWNKIRNERLELNKSIADMKVRLLSGDKKILDEDIKKQEVSLTALMLKEYRAEAELEKDINRGVNLSEEILNEENENKIIEKINEDEVKKALIFDLEELINSFESLSGLSKLLYTIIFSSTVMLGCIYSIILNIYGNYLLDRFKLEEKYPKIALFIKYRRNVSKYYLIINFVILINLCLINLILSISILSL